jgi:hypothetical protein
MAATLDDLYCVGDVYDAADACGQLTMRLGRLCRQRLLTEEDCKDCVQRVRTCLEAQLESDAS